MTTLPAVPASFEITAALNRALFAQAAVASAASALSEEESKLKEAMNALDGLLKANNMMGVASTLGNADYVPQTVYKAEDWPAFYKHIQATGEFDLLHKREGQTALRDRDSNNELPPGVRRTTFHKLVLTVK